MIRVRNLLINNSFFYLATKQTNRDMEASLICTYIFKILLHNTQTKGIQAHTMTRHLH